MTGTAIGIQNVGVAMMVSIGTNRLMPSAPAVGAKSRSKGNSV